uniref:Uncharacterized protein n=1 Tax=Lactuca sativa TaxID=4236 RepID=A0A9R1W8Y9_LACSA|nr:hypothetical protein LSAT_V11C300134750 [Lactuca sativa]
MAAMNSVRIDAAKMTSINDLASSSCNFQNTSIEHDDKKLLRFQDLTITFGNCHSTFKDYRSDKRGQWTLNQIMRNYRSRTECMGDIQRLNASFLAIYVSLIPPEEEKDKTEAIDGIIG